MVALELAVRLDQPAMVLMRPEIGGVQQELSWTQAVSANDGMSGSGGRLLDSLQQRQMDGQDSLWGYGHVGQETCAGVLRYTDYSCCAPTGVLDVLLAIASLILAEELGV